MISSAKSATVRRYKIHFSKTILFLEIIFFLVVLSSLILILSGWWLLAVLLLFFLLAVQFFLHDSIITQYPAGASIEIRMNPDRLICYDLSEESDYFIEDIKIIYSRWFVYIRLQQSPRLYSRLLLADSFDDKNHYSSFRRQLIEMTDTC